ncbi:MAG: UDP-3-O-[3-hydroxymyristoyl] N-acetylglucosamine deacetylase [Gammaproteobacteria bacterium]|nr:UDP-3-O-[3-hydroxymyristoyl] N-acetylglucosamine deacetylase [Gammaproteobacteria bacterium]
MVYSNPSTGASQCTTNEIIHYVGIGLHNGHNVSMTLYPAAPNTGICFLRNDVDPEHMLIRASWKNVIDTRLCTVLGNEHGVTVGTVEHLLAALRSCGVDNLLIEISGDEVPILDGSCAPLVDLINQAGVVGQRLPRFGIWIERPIEVRQGEHYAVLAPSDVPRITVDIEFANAVIGSQCVSVDLIDNVFTEEIAPARTFGFADELQQLHEQGLALGGSIRNAVLLDDDRVVNEEGLRFADEFARHKILDCLGDLALAEAPIFGHLYTRKPGHRLNNALLREMFAHEDAWSRLTYEEINHRIGKEQVAEKSWMSEVT